jgi:hypothetical protein
MSFFMVRERAPYLKPNRLQDLLAAIQSMALNDQYRRHISDWAGLISGNAERAAHWKAIFDDHPEFFRRATATEDNYALIWRRALHRRYHRLLQKVLTEEEYQALTPSEKVYMSRAPVPEGQIKTLMDTAISLHQRAVEANRDWRWWVPSALSLIGSFVGALIGVWLKR